LKEVADGLDEGVVGDDLFVEIGAELGGALLGFEVNVVDAETIGVAVGPLVVVHEGPAEVAFDGDAFRDSAMKLGDVVAEIHDAVGVVDVAVGG
jgi:hypothetical protein